MMQHVKEPTHVRGHTLDVVITRDTEDTVSNVDVTDPGHSVSSGNISYDHYAVILNARASKPANVRKTVIFRKLRDINIKTFKQDIRKSEIQYENIHYSIGRQTCSTKNKIYNPAADLPVVHR
ncbi:hypothetical protein DPMN_147414 [Dreissena polymorpha]|uniref:Uncharacterized protein n=1 Tax=Dreissena polymorpha TaxID=45954 RepID=A0A9D4FC55_DREPO|nr:hypothetical protein DPMN_147414 [Dreissena polymorpha]